MTIKATHARLDVIKSEYTVCMLSHKFTTPQPSDILAGTRNQKNVVGQYVCYTPECGIHAVAGQQCTGFSKVHTFTLILQPAWHVLCAQDLKLGKVTAIP